MDKPKPVISADEISRLYEALAGHKQEHAGARCLRYNGTKFYWYPQSRPCPEDQVVGIYNPGVAYSKFAEDICWAEEHMCPEKRRSRAKKKCA